MCLQVIAQASVLVIVPMISSQLTGCVMTAASKMSATSQKMIAAGSKIQTASNVIRAQGMIVFKSRWRAALVRSIARCLRCAYFARQRSEQYVLLCYACLKLCAAVATGPLVVLWIAAAHEKTGTLLRCQLHQDFSFFFGDLHHRVGKGIRPCHAFLQSISIGGSEGLHAVCMHYFVQIVPFFAKSCKTSWSRGNEDFGLNL